MVTSIIDDLKREFQSGTQVTRLILINVAVFVVMALVNVVANFPGSGGEAGWWLVIKRYLTLSNDWIFNLKHIWVFGTHMFLHIGVWHLVWNMVFIYWFGRRVGDWIGDKHIVPIYIYGGLASALMLILSDNIFHYVPADQSVYALGASGAAMAFVVASAVINPEAELNLLLIGPVRLKYVAAVLVFFDVTALGTNVNTGGHFGHLGGAIMGWFYIYALHNGWNLASVFSMQRQKKSGATIRKISDAYERRSTSTQSSQPFRQYFASKEQRNEAVVRNLDDEIDRILEKIKQQGIDSLTDDERKTLDQASET